MPNRAAANSRKYRDERRAKGLCCECGKVPPLAGKTKCQGCSDRQQFHNLQMQTERNALRAERIAAGLCRDCGAANTSGYVCCAVCKAKQDRLTQNRLSDPVKVAKRRQTDSNLWKRKRPSRLAYQRETRLRMKSVVVNAYGGGCACCGESGIDFLSIDHINGDGAERRRQGEPKGGDELYRWAIKHGFPSDLQVLCYNCNFAKRNLAQCPHAFLRQQQAKAHPDQLNLFGDNE